MPDSSALSVKPCPDSCPWFMYQLGQTEFRRVGILTNITSLFGKLYMRCNEDLQYRGPLPNHCIRSVDAASHIKSASSNTLDEKFWSWIFEIFSASYNRLPSGMTTRLPRRFPRLLQVCHLYSQFLSDSPRMFYDAWKHCNFTASIAAEVISSEGSAAISTVRLLGTFLRLHVRPWLQFGYGAPRWRLLRLLLLPLLCYWAAASSSSSLLLGGCFLFLFFATGYISRAYSRTHTEVRRDP